MKNFYIKREYPHGPDGIEARYMIVIFGFTFFLERKL